jgi:hypothetical protein
MFMPNEIRNPHTAPTRVHYPYTALEEFHPNGGMWAIPPAKDRPRFIEETSQLMANPAQFQKAMLVALRKWPHSVANALTNPALNHRAWIGHAGCYLATRSPEETTRLGWHQLDDTEQWAANHAADIVIAKWRTNHAGTLSAHQQTSLWGDNA